jgi:hypothetical protein
MGGTILWGFVVLMSIGTGAEIGAGRGGAVLVLLGLGRNKTVVVLVRGVKLWSPP